MKFAIRAHPDLQVVPPGTTVSYYAVADGKPLDELMKGYSFRWFCLNDPATLNADRVPRVSGPRARHWKAAKWGFAGRHTIVLEVRAPDGATTLYERVQRVDSAINILGEEFDPSANDNDPGPFQVQHHQTLYLRTLQRIAAQRPPPPDKKEAHEDRVELIDKYLGHLAFMLEGLEGKEGYAVDALHIDTERGLRTPLKLWLVNLTEDPRDCRWALVDWTNPLSERTSGRYDAEEDTHEEAIAALIRAWDSGNSYPEGRIRYQFDVPQRGIRDRGVWETDGRSFWGEVSDWLDYVALGAAVVAGVVTLIAPVPGSRVVSAAIWGALWTSIGTSTAAATINIAQRHSQGRGNWRDDTFDGLSIVGNLFAGAGAAWKVGARVTSAAGRLGPKMSKAVVIGQISSDGMQGVLLAADHLGDFDGIMNDPGLTPEERLQRLMALFGSAAVSGTMTYLSVKGGKADLDGLNAAANPNRVIDVDQPAPAQELGASQTRVETETATDPGHPPREEPLQPVAPAARAMDAPREDFSRHLKRRVKADCDAAVQAHGRRGRRERVAIARAGVSDDFGSISPPYVNLTHYVDDPSSLRFGDTAPPGVSDRIETGFARRPPHRDGYFEFEIPDTNAYLAMLQSWYSAAGRPLHPRTKKLITEYIDRMKRNHSGRFRGDDGLPGTHAEVLAINDVLWRHPAAKIKDLEVATYKLVGKQAGSEFPACSNCSGILGGLGDRVLTGVTGE